jgi:hypothetical protein
MVLEPTGGTSFKTVRKDTARTLTNANALNTFTGMSLPIEPTQRLGLYAPPGVGASPGSPCAFTTMNSSDVVIQAANGEPGDSPVNYNFASASSRRLNASAVVEPDCDNDGLGDETQDANLSSCTPGTIPTGPAPTLPGGAQATCRGVPATIVGTEGSDVRSGSQGPDVIVGLGGNDTLSGLAGNDLICGGKGKDKLKGGAGNDQLSGQKGNDKLYGQKGNDKLSGKAGNDTLKGGPGKDILKGGAGKDKQVQ